MWISLGIWLSRLRWSNLAPFFLSLQKRADFRVLVTITVTTNTLSDFYIDPEHEALIDRISSLSEQGLTMKAIAEALNEQGFLSHSGKAFYPKLVGALISKGARLFSNPPAEETVRLLSKNEEAPIEGDRLLVSVPLNLPKKFILQRFRSLLDQNHKGQRGKRYAKTSKAKYQFMGQPNIEALTTALNVWDKRIEHPKMKLWELGQFLPLNKHLYVDYLKSGKPLDTASKKLMEATVSRYLKKARASVTNTSKGIFP